MICILIEYANAFFYSVFEKYEITLLEIFFYPDFGWPM